jgi:hypothetical protein
MRGYRGLTTFNRSSESDAMLASFEADGAIFITDFLSSSGCASLAETVKRMTVSHSAGGQDTRRFWQRFHGERTTRFTGIGRYSDVFFDLLEDPLFGRLADQVLGGGGTHYWMNTCQAMMIGPGEPAQVLHRDGQNWATVQAALWPRSPELTISMMIALDEVWPELGATRVVSGSHRWADFERRPALDEVEAGAFRTGDALIYSGALLHGGGANETSDQSRWALHLSFVVGWLTPEEAITEEYPSTLLKGRSERVKRLLGHTSYEGPPAQGGRLWLKNFDHWQSSD